MPDGEFWTLIPLPDLGGSKGDHDHNLTSVAKFCGFTLKLRWKSEEVYSQADEKDFKCISHNWLIIDS